MSAVLTGAVLEEPFGESTLNRPVHGLGRRQHSRHEDQWNQSGKARRVRQGVVWNKSLRVRAALEVSKDARCHAFDIGVSTENAVGLILGILVLGYLVYALVFPERF